jgi:hypothetical protein
VVKGGFSERAKMDKNGCISGPVPLHRASEETNRQAFFALTRIDGWSCIMPLNSVTDRTGISAICYGTSPEAKVLTSENRSAPDARESINKYVSL